MSETSPLPESDEADNEKQTTPAGVARDLEEKADDEGATTSSDESAEPRD